MPKTKAKKATTKKKQARGGARTSRRATPKSPTSAIGKKPKKAKAAASKKPSPRKTKKKSFNGKPVGKGGKKGVVPEHLLPHLFKPGEAPKGAGRPKGRLGLISQLRKILAEQDSEGITRGQKVMNAMVGAAQRGDIRHIKEILDRIEGKVPERLVASLNGPLAGLSDDELAQIVGAGSVEADGEGAPS